MTQRRTRVVTVRDHMQEDYRYELTASPGRDFHSDFRPELTPKQMLALGVFCGKYMTDCRNEFPAAWFARAKLSPERRDCSLNYFGVNASQPLSMWRKKGWIYPDDPPRMVPMVLSLLYGPANARRGCATDQALEGDASTRGADQTPLRTP